MDFESIRPHEFVYDNIKYSIPTLIQFVQLYPTIKINKKTFPEKILTEQMYDFKSSSLNDIALLLDLCLDSPQPYCILLQDNSKYQLLYGHSHILAVMYNKLNIIHTKIITTSDMVKFHIYSNKKK